MKNPRPKGGGDCEEWSTGHVDGRPALHLLQTDPAKSVGTPLYPYISPPTAEDPTTHSTYSSLHVKVWFSSSSVGEVLLGVKHSLELQK
jgi:hypothetical protein